VHKEHVERYVKMLLFLLIPLIGVYFVYNSMKTGIIMSVNYSDDKSEMFPLNEIIRQNRLNEFKSLMTVKLGTRVRP
jgi:putative Mn2+ efflux pump MntP